MFAEAFPKRMASDGEFCKRHFNSDGDFLSRDPDSITGEPDVLSARISKPVRPILGLMQSALQVPAAGVDQPTHDRCVVNLADLVVKCLRPDPEDRIEPAKALDLPFFRRDR